MGELDWKAVLEQVQKSQRQYTEVLFPKFRFEDRHDLKPTLSQMGLAPAFAKSPLPDFTGIDGKGEIYLNLAMHGTMIAVDEFGTIAAGYSIIGSATLGEPPPPPFLFIADHPFLFLIHDTKTGVILFIGRVTDPRG